MDVLVKWYLQVSNLFGCPTFESQPYMRYLDLFAKSVFFLLRDFMILSAASFTPSKADIMPLPIYWKVELPPFKGFSWCPWWRSVWDWEGFGGFLSGEALPSELRLSPLWFINWTPFCCIELPLLLSSIVPARGGILFVGLFMILYMAGETSNLSSAR